MEPPSPIKTQASTTMQRATPRSSPGGTPGSVQSSAATPTSAGSATGTVGSPQSPVGVGQRLSRQNSNGEPSGALGLCLCPEAFGA